MSTETDDGHDDHHHHLPAVEDWPRGFGEASWWPFVTALGGAGIYIGVALWIIADLTHPLAGPAVLAGSVGLFLLGSTAGCITPSLSNSGPETPPNTVIHRFGGE